MRDRPASRRGNRPHPCLLLCCVGDPIHESWSSSRTFCPVRVWTGFVGRYDPLGARRLHLGGCGLGQPCVMSSITHGRSRLSFANPELQIGGQLKPKKKE
ncbi:hypothetical protein Micbo1qcDRAFT_157061 [Microdochium bolleyi]|uniref:Uncharacterized protein n=1 Tax=Microdochium bolleyi TaxID=196109 RepID=A0A136JDJ9_9PEZI|nr:hypothetical protein Micbo1qcDRAFT_157061 [Microdochium bolleyi]